MTKVNASGRGLKQRIQSLMMIIGCSFETLDFLKRRVFVEYRAMPFGPCAPRWIVGG